MSEIYTNLILLSTQSYLLHKLIYKIPKKLTTTTSDC